MLLLKNSGVIKILVDTVIKGFWMIGLSIVKAIDNIAKICVSTNLISIIAKKCLKSNLDIALWAIKLLILVSFKVC